MQSVEEALEKLQKSPFRAKFHLSEEERRKRLAPAEIPNDGKQTPMRGHPVFKAQHACACCCRGCLNRWYHVPQHTVLTEQQQQKIVRLLMAWIEKETEK